ncbi:hypothetical protein ACFFSY_10270 [Paenibacillus aurantiacus]|uniref:Uncharacterized protein n=1 Tax=Paenibacillus aurantiacus TaxID=1936118 RepID=A0ABV5KQ00_9BACL
METIADRVVALKDSQWIVGIGIMDAARSEGESLETRYWQQIRREELNDV